MIGRRDLPPDYLRWNERWGAPFGHPCAQQYGIGYRLRDPDIARFGPFAFQVNASTRQFEYPWAYFTARPAPGMRVLEVGGGLSGLQFVLALEGCDVTNVDPSSSEGWSLMPGMSWSLSLDNIRMLNAAFGTDVHIVEERVQDAPLPDGAFDRVFCMSVLEHVDVEEGKRVLRAVERLLAPGGLCLVTVDLFLDLRPFGVLDRNFWGTNVDVHELVGAVDMELVCGDRRELFGFPEFDEARVVRLLPELLIGHYPALSQAFALRRRG